MTDAERALLDARLADMESHHDYQIRWVVVKARLERLTDRVELTNGATNPEFGRRFMVGDHSSANCRSAATNRASRVSRRISLVRFSQPNTPTP